MFVCIKNFNIYIYLFEQFVVEFLPIVDWCSSKIAASKLEPGMAALSAAFKFWFSLTIMSYAVNNLQKNKNSKNKNDLDNPQHFDVRPLPCLLSLAPLRRGRVVIQALT